MKNTAIFFMMLSIVAFGCGNGGGGKADADTGEVPEDREAIEDTVPDADVPAEDLPADNGPPDDAGAEDVLEDESMDVPAEEQEDVHEVIPDNYEEFDPGQACLDSGGTVDTMLCCLAVDDFPNLCLEGPCGCSPEYSHEILVCLCGSGKCFNGFSCVPM